jgi:HEAT repeat protein
VIADSTEPSDDCDRVTGIAQDALARLAHPDSRQRELAAAELGDLLRSDAVDLTNAELVITRLVELVLTDQEHTIAEEALNSIGEGFGHLELPLRLVMPLVRRMPSLPPDLIEYALNILGCTHDPAARPMIVAYLEHPVPAVRDSAEEALRELPGRHV